MKILTLALLLTSSVWGATEASARCMTAREGRIFGQGEGGSFCLDAQHEFVSRFRIRPMTFGGDRICDSWVARECRAGFDQGFHAGRAQNIAGIRAPDCTWLLNNRPNMRMVQFYEGRTLRTEYFNVRAFACEVNP